MEVAEAYNLPATKSWAEDSHTRNLEDVFAELRPLRERL